MINTQTIKIGFKFIEGGEVYKIFKLEERKVGGKTERIVHYRPFFTNSINKTLICTIPASSLKDINIRAPLSKKEMSELLLGLTQKSERHHALDISEAKTILSLNDIYKTVSLIKFYWKEKKERGIKFSQSNRDVLKLTINKIVEEVALVAGLTLDEAETEITAALNKQKIAVPIN